MKKVGSVMGGISCGNVFILGCIIFSFKDEHAGVNYPPMHSRAPYTGSMEGTRTVRYMFNNEVKVGKSLNYKEWHKNMLSLTLSI